MCPLSLQIAHSLGLLAGGALAFVGMEEEVVVMEEPVAEEEEAAAVEVPVAQEEVVVVSDGSGTAGLGQVVSLHSSGQYSLILL